MICELYNRIAKFINGNVFGIYGNYSETEVSLTNVIFVITYGTIITLTVVWWYIPIKKLMDYTDNVTFKCNKNEIKEK